MGTGLNFCREVAEPVEHVIRPQRQPTQLERVQPLMGRSLQRPVVEVEAIYVDVRVQQTSPKKS